ncbi:unnamed protein product [Cuscuta epithymum]|uniref:Uncharacterized protein n=1 Tax=Cuscuta epithymum TaxID=186058 RepID=A0AAV0D4E6_9ASTE|nr:unnamed protein product [Cuscuta epithymum]
MLSATFSYKIDSIAMRYPASMEFKDAMSYNVTSLDALFAARGLIILRTMNDCYNLMQMRCDGLIKLIGYGRSECMLCIMLSYADDGDLSEKIQAFLKAYERPILDQHWCFH